MTKANKCARKLRSYGTKKKKLGKEGRKEGGNTTAGVRNKFVPLPYRILNIIKSGAKVKSEKGFGSL